MCDKSNIRDYVQYLETSQSRSGRPPEEIPKPKFMSLIAELIGAYCPALGPIPGKFTVISQLLEKYFDIIANHINEFFLKSFFSH